MNSAYADSSRAIELMENAEYMKAVAVIQASIDSATTPDKERVSLWWLKGVCLVSLNKGKEAKLAFEKLLSLAPHFQPESNTSPKILRTFQEIKVPPKHSAFTVTWPYWLALGATLIGGATLGIVFGTMKSEGSMRIAFN